MNIWAFIGRVGRDAELKYTPNGKAVLSFPVAVDSGYGDRKVTTWPRVQVWDKRAEALANHIAKGDKIGVVGELSLREYQGKEGKAFSLEVRATDITLIGGAKEKPAKQAAGIEVDPFIDSDCPF